MERTPHRHDRCPAGDSRRAPAIAGKQVGMQRPSPPPTELHCAGRAVSSVSNVGAQSVLASAHVSTASCEACSAGIKLEGKQVPRPPQHWLSVLAGSTGPRSQVKRQAPVSSPLQRVEARHTALVLHAAVLRQNVSLRGNLGQALTEATTFAVVDRPAGLGSVESSAGDDRRQARTRSSRRKP